MKHVPDAQSVPSGEDQLTHLLRKLAGHKAFARIRGKLGGANSLLAVTERLMDESENSLSGYNASWEDLAKDVAVVTRILVQYRRDGWYAAAGELREALKTPGHVMSGETFALDQMVPMTIVAPNFRALLAFVRWARGGNCGRDLNRLYHGDRHGEPEGLMAELDAALPRLRDGARLHQWPFAQSFLSAYLSDAARAGMERLAAPDLGLKLLNGRMYRGMCDASFCDITQRVPLVWVYPTEQSVVQRAFPRTVQDEISTWQILLPKIVVEMENWWCENGLFLGFHPETDHAVQRSRTRLWASTGCQQGYGVALTSPLRHFYLPGAGEKLLPYPEVGDKTLHDPFRFMLDLTDAD